jgi:hypothetical protein
MVLLLLLLLILVMHCFAVKGVMSCYNTGSFLTASDPAVLHCMYLLLLHAANASQEVDEPPSCRLLTFWEYLEQCK